MANRFDNWERRKRRYDEEEGRYYNDRDYDQGRFGRQSNYGRDYESGRRGYDEPTWTYTETWLVIGPATGLGPQGYQRSDERIHEDVCERLTQHGQIDASNMEVKVENGEVTLEGTVEDRRTKRMAEDVAEAVPGVRDVHNRLRIGALGWAEGQADEEHALDSEGWVEGMGHQPHDSEGWPEGQAQRSSTGDPKGWARGVAEEQK